VIRPVFIVGCGYVGGHVARRLFARHGERHITALARGPDSAARLRALGISPLEGDLDRPESLRTPPLADSLLYYFAPPPAQGLDDPRLRAFLQAIDAKHPPARIVLISTTGVYGDCGGAWVDESWPAHPQTDRARRRLAAEQALQAWSAQSGVPAWILRVPGIYGPDRLPVERLRKGLPVLREDLSPYSNRVHVHDLVRACIAAGECGEAGIYNISDGQPTSMTDYFFQVADALGLPRPPVLDRAAASRRLSQEILGYLAESKRLDNRKMREVLGVIPDYPDLASGLARCVRIYSCPKSVV
jgi:nucleoside-diphosphate-sugar epimerase